MPVELNKKLFSSRLSRIYDKWNDAASDSVYTPLVDLDAFILLAGDPSGEDEPVKKGTCFQQWLLGYEFPSTLLLFTKEKVFALCSASKAKTLAQIQNAHPTIKVEMLAQAGKKEPQNDSLEKFVEQYTSYSRVGILSKEKHSGKLVADWEQGVSGSSSKPEQVDITSAVSGFLSEKDAEELQTIQTAGSLTSTLLKHYIAPKLETILDKEAKTPHSTLSATIEGRLGSGEGETAKGPDMKVWNKGEGLKKVDWDSVEMIYPPIIQSSSSGYDLRITAESTDNVIEHKGVLLVSVGMKYKSYCANLGRTFIVDPSKEQESHYQFLLTLQKELLKFIKEGVTGRDVYNHAFKYIENERPSLVKNFVKSIGFATGVEFRDSTYLLSAKNSNTLKRTMVLNLALGFQDLVDDNGRKYALQLTDTVRVGENGSSLITDGTKAIGDTLFFLTRDDEDKPKKDKKLPAAPKANGHTPKQAGGKTLRGPSRRNDEVQASALAKFREHQRALHEKLKQEGLAKYNEDGVPTAGTESKGWKKFQSYKGEGALPPQVEKCKIYVDRKAQTVVLPIQGFAVPFHINTIKNASRSDEGEYTHLRINFQTPGQAGAARKDDQPFEDPDATFVRSVSYRSTDSRRFDELFKAITDLKREANKRDQQKKEMADVVEQDSLIETRNRRPIRMQECNMRPAFDGKRYMGDVEIHENGVRYLSHGGQKLDVLFSNIKHLFFQPCDHELIVLVHLNLKTPIMIGKKKAFDVQFYKEASDMAFDETGNRKRKHRYGDEDEIEMEQQERKHRQMLNKETRLFAEKIAEAATASTGETMELDIPFRELSFEGVPHRSAVRLQPTTDCLVQLTDPPFTVVDLSEIEIASLERMQYGLKQFDLCLVFKDFTRPILHINSIDSRSLEDVRNWLDSVDIAMTESQVNLNWAPVMKHVNENPHAFFADGGWSFLGGGTAGAETESDEPSSASEFEADSDAFEESTDEDDGSEFDDDSGSSASGSDFDDGDSEGDDWDELERKAAKSDKKKVAEGRKGGDSDSEDDRPKKKAPTKANGKKKTNGVKSKR